MNDDHRLPASRARDWEHLVVQFDPQAATLEAQVEEHERRGWELVLVAPPRYGSLSLMMHFRRPVPLLAARPRSLA